MIYTDAQWRSFLTALGREADLAKEPMLRNMTSRTINSEALFTMVSDITRTLTTAHWVATLRAVGLTVVAMKSLEELVDDSHLAATGFFHDARTSNGESLRLFGHRGRLEQWAPARCVIHPLIWASTPQRFWQMVGRRDTRNRSQGPSHSFGGAPYPYSRATESAHGRPLFR